MLKQTIQNWQEFVKKRTQKKQEERSEEAKRSAPVDFPKLDLKFREPFTGEAYKLSSGAGRIVFYRSNGGKVTSD